MKSAILFTFFLLAGKSLLAQHCPYDGTHLVAIKVVDKNGKMLTNNSTFFICWKWITPWQTPVHLPQA